MATHIHVVLTDDLTHVGKTGELVRVRPGYARNYLIPRGLAISATAENVARIEHSKRVVESKNAKARGEAQELAQKLPERQGHDHEARRRGRPSLRLRHLARHRGRARGPGLHGRPPPHRDRAHQGARHVHGRRPTGDERVGERRGHRLRQGVGVDPDPIGEPPRA